MVVTGEEFNGGINLRTTEKRCVGGGTGQRGVDRGQVDSWMESFLLMPAVRCENA